MVPKRIKERRRFERAPFVIRVDCRTVDEFFSDFSSNINEGGMFIETPKEHTPDTPVRLEFRLPGSEDTVTVNGKIAWVRKHEEALQGPPGVGIQFESLSVEAKETINRIVRNLKTV